MDWWFLTGTWRVEICDPAGNRIDVYSSGWSQWAARILAAFLTLTKRDDAKVRYLARNG